MRSAHAGRPLYLAFLPDFLFKPDDAPARYIGRAWLANFIPTAVLSIIVVALELSFGARSGPGARVIATAGPLIYLVLVGPLIETFIMAVALLLLDKMVGAGPAVVLSAIGWGIAHSLSNWPGHGLVAWWGFLIMSIAFLTWKQRGFGAGLSVATAIHMLQNSTVAFVLLLQLAVGRG